MKRFRFLAVAIMMAIAAQGALAAQAGGFVGGGIGMTPDYEGSDDYEAAAAFFGR